MGFRAQHTLAKDMEPTIIHKDRHIIVLDKPAGMPSSNVEGGNRNSLANWIVGQFPKQAKLETGGVDAGLVHRLDNDTSGLIVAARSDKDYKALRDTWGTKNVTKEYFCLVIGQVGANKKINTLIAHHPDKTKKMTVVNTEAEAKELGARFAETEFEILEGFFDYTLLKVRISTGVRHQIRVHLASIGHPLAGDRLYQREKHVVRDWLRPERHMLHCSRLVFPHPASQKPLEFHSPLSSDFLEILEKLGQTSDTFNYVRRS